MIDIINELIGAMNRGVLVVKNPSEEFKQELEDNGFCLVGPQKGTFGPVSPSEVDTFQIVRKGTVASIQTQTNGSAKKTPIEVGS